MSDMSRVIVREGPALSADEEGEEEGEGLEEEERGGEGKRAPIIIWGDEVAESESNEDTSEGILGDIVAESASKEDTSEEVSLIRFTQVPVIRN